MLRAAAFPERMKGSHRAGDHDCGDRYGGAVRSLQASPLYYSALQSTFGAGPQPLPLQGLRSTRRRSRTWSLSLRSGS